MCNSFVLYNQDDHQNVCKINIFIVDDFIGNWNLSFFGPRIWKQNEGLFCFPVNAGLTGLLKPGIYPLSCVCEESLKVGWKTKP